jgi:CRP/FNR family cyclic AMP-dependent transcriptional regulator
VAEGIVLQVLSQVDIFKDLTTEELIQVARICTPRTFQEGDVVFEEDSQGDDLYVIHKGSVEVVIWARTPEGESRPTAINTIWQGRSFGEMVLIGGGTRSATIRCLESCLFLVINRYDFDRVCEQNPRIGYRVMRNIAEDLVYKLRSSSLLLRGQVKWQGGELAGWR